MAVLEFIQRACAHPGDPEGKLVHTASLAWRVHAVRRENEFSGLLESDAVVQPLDAYGTNGWEVLVQSGLLRPQDVLDVRDSCRYDDEHFAFIPAALCSPGARLQFAQKPRMTSEELAFHDERAARGLAAGRFCVSKEARSALGEGFSRSLRPGQGVSVLAMMDMQLSSGVLLLGWGWLWAAPE